MKEHVFNNLSRKSFLRGSLAAAVAASSASLLSACGGSASGDGEKKGITLWRKQSKSYL